jgi:hypothetical protein
MKYKFVTREDVIKQFKSLCEATKDVHGSAIIIGLAAHLRHLCEHAISERDAYREVAIEGMRGWSPRITSKEIDAEAARIMDVKETRK